MKLYVPICVLLLSSVIDASTFLPTNVTDFENNLYMINDDQKLVKLDVTEEYDKPIIEIEHLPNFLTFSLYTKKSNNPEILKIDDVNVLNNSNFDSKKPTKIITHGWVNTARSPACTLVRDAFLQNGDYNVIVMDWSPIALAPYTWSSNHVRKIGKVLARMIDFLDSQGASVSNMTLVGHSLGAHVVGLSSYYAKKKVSYVVGLDPAGPNFYQRLVGSRLSEEDAEYVQVIHTSGRLGCLLQLGHADFYPNGGLVQTDCLLFDAGGVCSHTRSYHFYVAAINNNRIEGHSCNNYVEYLLGACNSTAVAAISGVIPDTSVRGQYFFASNWTFPFVFQI